MGLITELECFVDQESTETHPILLQLLVTVLSTYLTDIQGSIDENGNSLRQTRPIMCNTYYEGGSQGMHLRHGSQPERMPVIKGTPQLQPW